MNDEFGKEFDLDDNLDVTTLETGEDEKAEAIAKREEFEKNLSNVWGYSDLGLEAKKAAMAMLATKTGMYARIPIYCKADSCPYSDSCLLLTNGLAPKGEPCPKETADVEMRYAAYNKEFDLDNASFVDKNLISEIINCDIMLDRLKALMSAEGTIIQDVVTGMTESGEQFTHPEVSKTWEAYERISKRRDNDYNLMVATRKDNKKDDSGDKELLQMILDKVQSDSFVYEEKPENIKDAEIVNNDK